MEDENDEDGGQSEGASSRGAKRSHPDEGEASGTSDRPKRTRGQGSSRLSSAVHKIIVEQPAASAVIAAGSALVGTAIQSASQAIQSTSSEATVSENETTVKMQGLHGHRAAAELMHIQQQDAILRQELADRAEEKRVRQAKLDAEGIEMWDPLETRRG